jgi:hypothetical protein
MGAGESQEEGRREEMSLVGSQLRMASLNKCVKRETLSSTVGIGVDLGMDRGGCA